jgi:hypothetical protein
MAVLTELADFVGKLIHLPGDVLSDVAGIFPNSKGHEDIDKYCADKGGKMVNGVCQMTMNVTPELHGQMLQALEPQKRFEDMSLDEQHDVLKTQLAKQGEYPEEPSPTAYGDDMFKRFTNGGTI